MIRTLMFALLLLTPASSVLAQAGTPIEPKGDREFGEGDDCAGEEPCDKQCPGTQRCVVGFDAVECHCEGRMGDDWSLPCFAPPGDGGVNGPEVAACFAVEWDRRWGIASAILAEDVTRSVRHSREWGGGEQVYTLPAESLSLELEYAGDTELPGRAGEWEEWHVIQAEGEIPSTASAAIGGLQTPPIRVSLCDHEAAKRPGFYMNQAARFFVLKEATEDRPAGFVTGTLFVDLELLDDLPFPFSLAWSSDQLARAVFEVHGIVTPGRITLLPGGPDRSHVRATAPHP